MTQTHTQCKTVEPEKFNTKTRNRLALLFVAALAGSVLVQLTFHPHALFELDGKIWFYPVFGLVMSIGLVLVSKMAGFFLKRRETYWEKK